MTRLGVKEISWLGVARASQLSKASTSLRVTLDAILESKEIFQKDFEREGQPRHLVALQSRQCEWISYS